MDVLRRLARSILARAVLTVALLAVVGLQIDWRAARHSLATGNWAWFAAAVGLLVVALGVGAARWHVLLHGASVFSPPSRTFRAYAVGTFSNNFLPSSFGGDAARAFMVGRSHAAMVRATTSVLVDRLSSLGCLFIVAWVAVASSPGSVPTPLLLALLVATGGGVLLGALGYLALRPGGLGRRLPERLRRWGREGRTALGAYARDRRLLLYALGLGVLFQALSVTAVWLLAKAIDTPLAFAVVAVTVPLVLVITVVPISIAGFGLREGGFVVLLAKAGVPATQATLISLLGVAALALSSLPGAAALLWPGATGAPPERTGLGSPT